MKTTTVKIDAARREELREAAWKISMERKEMVTMSEVIKYLIDNYTEKAIEEMKKGKTEES